MDLGFRTGVVLFAHLLPTKQECHDMATDREAGIAVARQKIIAENQDLLD